MQGYNISCTRWVDFTLMHIWRPGDRFYYPGGLVGIIMLDNGHRLYTVSWLDMNGEESGIVGIVPDVFMKPCADNVMPMQQPDIAMRRTPAAIQKLRDTYKARIRYRQACDDALSLNR